MVPIHPHRNRAFGTFFVIFDFFIYSKFFELIGREQNHLLNELIAIQSEQQELLQALFVENSVTEEDNDAAESENNENLEDSEEKSEKK